MIPELDTYFEQIRNAFFLGHTIGGYSFESLSKEGGVNLSNPDNTYAVIKAVDEYILDRRGVELSDRKRILERVLLDTEKLITEIESLEIGVQLDFAEFAEGEFTGYAYLAKVNEQFISFKWDLIKLCQKYEVDVSGFPIYKGDPTFPELFQPKYKVIPEICKIIFNAVESPKNYAIMFSLLEENRLLRISPNCRTKYFKAWYKYVNKSEPNSGKWGAINDHFKGKDDQRFNNEKDPAYKKFKEDFEQALKECLIASKY